MCESTYGRPLRLVSLLVLGHLRTGPEGYLAASCCSIYAVKPPSEHTQYQLKSVRTTATSQGVFFFAPCVPMVRNGTATRPRNVAARLNQKVA
jgi:hypothetical protein